MPSEPHEYRATSRWSETFCQKMTAFNSKGTKCVGNSRCGDDKRTKEGSRPTVSLVSLGSYEAAQTLHVLGIERKRLAKMDVVDSTRHSRFGASFLSAAPTSLPTLLFFATVGPSARMDLHTRLWFGGSRPRQLLSYVPSSAPAQSLSEFASNQLGTRGSRCRKDTARQTLRPES